MNRFVGEEDFLTQKEAQKVLGISEYYFKKFLKEGTMKLKGVPATEGSSVMHYSLRDVKTARRELEERKDRIARALENAKPLNHKG